MSKYTEKINFFLRKSILHAFFSPKLLLNEYINADNMNKTGFLPLTTNTVPEHDTHSKYLLNEWILWHKIFILSNSQQIFVLPKQKT